MGSLALLSATTLNEEQEDLIRIAHICGEQLSLIINDILGSKDSNSNRMLRFYRFLKD
jgi:hypothetical protein